MKNYNIKYYYNPFYDVTNSIASAWFAKDFLSEYDETLIMNGDVFLADSLLVTLLKSKKSPVMFADSTRKEIADYKFQYKDGLLLKYGKDLVGDEISGEYIGVGKFSKEIMPEFINIMDKMLSEQKHSVWWENIIYSMVGKKKVYVDEINGEFWAEVDYIEDYERILKFRDYKVDFNINVYKSIKN